MNVFFGIYDYVVFVSTIVVSISIGIFFCCHDRSNKSTNNFIAGSRKQKVLPLAISLMVSFESSIMVLGMPAEAYVHGIMYMLSFIGFMLALILGAFIYAKFFHQLGITSIYEYLQLRFKSPVLRNIGMVSGILVYVWYMGIVLYGPGIALEAVTGFPLWYSITLITVSSIIYTAMGGLKAVIWTDVLQCVIMYTALIAGFIKGVSEIGSFQEVIDIARRDGRLNFDFRFDPWIRHTVWGLIFGNFLRAFNTVFNQSTFQRITATSTPKDAVWVMLLTGPLYALTTAFAMFQGLTSYAYFKKKRCDPLASGQLTNPNQIMPLYMIMIFDEWPGMPGLFVAGLFSASLSTLSSGLSSVSAITWVDIIKPRIKSNVSDMTGVIVCKLSIVFYGFLSMGVAFLVSMVEGTLTQIGDSLLGALAGPITGIIFFATLCPWANTKSALIGGIVGWIMTSWIAVGSVFSTTRTRTPYLPPAPIDHCPDFNATSVLFTSATNHTAEPVLKGMDWLYSLSYTLIAPVGIFLVLIIGTAISLPSYNPYSVDKRYIVPLLDTLCCCLPKRIRRVLEREGSSAHKTEMETIQIDRNEKETKINTIATTMDYPNIEHPL